MEINKLKPPHVRIEIENFMIDNGCPEEIVRPLFVAPSYLWRMITVVQSLKVHPEGMVGNHTLKVLQNLRVINKVTLWAALFHDVGKTVTTKVVGDKITAHGHEAESVRIANIIMMSNDYFNDIYDEVIFCISQHMRIKYLHQMRPAKRETLKSHKYFGYLKELAYADSMGGLGILDWMEGLKI